MKRSEAARYARWSAAAALLLGALTAGVYVQRKWAAHREKQKAPPSAPKDVSRLLNGISFSKMDGNQKIFTVDASKSTDFKDRDASLLEEVKITIFGKTGARHDIIHTQSCQYERVGGGITCNGDVRFDLQSAADAEQEAKQPRSTAKQKVHVETRGVKFNRATGMASTDQRVKFVFPNGSGEAVGLEYLSEAGEMRLLRNVHLLLSPPETDVAKSGISKTAVREPVQVTGKSLDFGRDSRIMHLHGPLRAESSKAQLVAGELTLSLDTAFRAEKLVATAGGTGKNPELASSEKNGALNLRAETLTAHFAPEGWLTSIEGLGNVQGSRNGGTESEEFTSENASLELLPKVNQPRMAKLTGNVVVRTARTSDQQRALETGALLVEFAARAEGQPAKPRHAETLSAGSIEWTDAAMQGGTSGSTMNTAATRTKLQAEKLEMAFGDEGQAKELIATGNVRTERAMAGKPLQTASAQKGFAQLLANGGWSEMDLQGSVKLKEADRSGQADHVVFVRASQNALLTGKAVARDADTETQAPRITFSQETGDIHAEGGVRSTDFSAKGSAVQLAPVPVNISSGSMQGNAKTGRAVYSGNARLWQGDSVLEADSIELLRETKVLNAAGNVRAVFAQAASPSFEQNPPPQATPKRPKLWHITAGTLTYRDAESRAHLEKSVVAQSTEQTMRGSAVDLYFTRSGTAGATTANVPSGAQQISRAVGTGGVIVEQGTRKATADRGEYSAADGKFVMSGGNPAIYDASQGTTTGRQLTFFLADDTIIVDSENGSRTLTKHRVEK
jgi:lipopolysaccharide export system protein LptA